ncbi:MAG: ABC transporter permease [Aestuariivita sp.]|nr:ABC transporter permease [Aestuariivita sp.]MCE8009747.1 ABC transporter permease [Aestuariivita sp.]
MVAPAQVPRTRNLRSGRTIFALMLREMATTYGRSVMGYLWALIEPVAALALLSIVFALVLRSPSLGSNFPLFYASGYLMFQIYMIVGNKVASAVQFSRPLLEYPAVTPLDAILARFMLNMLTQMMVIYIVLTGIIVIYDLKLILDLSSILLALLMAGALTLGIGTMNCYLFVAFPAYVQVWAIANRPMFIISCIFFLFEDIPQQFRDFLWYNPLVHIVGMMRRGIYATYEANYISVTYVMGLSLLFFLIGLMLLRRHLRDALNI